MSLNRAQIEALIGAKHADPFAVLGMHTGADGALWVRALLPAVRRVFLLDALSEKRICELRKVDDEGLFEGRVPRRRKRFDYRLGVEGRDRDAHLIADAFAFGPQLSHEQLIALREGRHPQPATLLGAHPIRVEGVSGARFALWAPNASRVSVVGDFNEWDGRCHPMRLRHDAGVWETFVPGVELGALYKYELLDRQGQLLPLKADPYARASELRPDSASRVAAWPFRVHLVDEAEKYDAMRAATAALATSGTVSTELALAGTPMVIAYRIGALSYELMKRVVTAKHITLFNIAADARIAPEFIQNEASPDILAPAVQRLLADHEAAADQARRQTAALDLMGRGGPDPSALAADAVLQVIEAKRGG